MDIQGINVYEAPNIYCLSKPIVKIQLKLGKFVDVPTKDIGNLNNEIIKIFPGIKYHKCSTGNEGGFLERLREGTYLAHVTEHLCLETLNLLDFDIRYGKTRHAIDDSYYVIFACPNVTIGKACGNFVINILNDLIEGKTPDINLEFNRLKEFCSKYDQGVSTGAIIEEAEKRRIPVSIINDGEIIRLGLGKYQKRITATLFEGTSSIAVDSACNKHLTKILLEEAFIPVPKGKVCLSVDEAVKGADEIGYPVVVKPKSGNKGKLVFLNLNSEAEVRLAFEESKTFDGEVIVEKCIEGKDYRLLVVGGKVVASAERAPAQIMGDGLHSIEELIAEENRNELRGEDHEKPLTKIKVDKNVIATLKKQDLNLESIPQKDQSVKLRENANLSTGGTAIDCTDMVHPKNIEAAARAASTIGLDIAGIDMVIPDISEPIGEDYGAIIEVNASPGIRMHLKPTAGKKRDVASSILNMIYPEGKPFTIPIISITGTNGKTTTARMISHILRHNGYKVGMTTTHGIYLDNNCIVEGDTTGPKSARYILNHHEVDIAVLETARGGIIRNGLAYKEADVAVFTNLSEDHLGIDGINTMDDLLYVKSLVIEAVKETGMCVLNADDFWVMKAREKAKGYHILFSINDKNPILLNHISEGGNAVYKRGNDIYINHKGKEKDFISLNDIPATLNGKLKHNIYNSMSAIAAAYALDMPFVIVKDALKTFNTSATVNPGRFNIYDLGEFKVVLDYGHNIEGYRVTIDGLKALNHSQLIGIIGAPGDRLNKDITNIGKISGASFNYVYVKEDKDLRGRQHKEVASLLYQGALLGGIARENVEIVLDEIEALRKALKQARKGDLIVVFFEKMEPLIEIIEKFELKSKEIIFV